MTLGIRQRRAERKRRWRFLSRLLLVAVIVGAGALLYQTGAEISKGQIAGLEAEIARLAARERELGERNARLEVATADAQRAQAKAQARYEADVPQGKARELQALTGDLLGRGVAAERIGRMIEAAGRKLDCADEPATRRFLVRTPIYRGANDAVTFADNAITVTAAGNSARNNSGAPEAWFDPAQPVTVKFVEIGGTPSEVSGLLPLHHSVLWNDAEYRFAAVAADQRGFLNVSATRCGLPAE